MTLILLVSTPSLGYQEPMGWGQSPHLLVLVKVKALASIRGKWSHCENKGWLSSSGTLTIEKSHPISRHPSPRPLSILTEDSYHHAGKGRILLHPRDFDLHLSALISFLKILFFFSVFSEIFHFMWFHFINSLRIQHYTICCRILSLWTSPARYVYLTYLVGHFHWHWL